VPISPDRDCAWYNGDRRDFDSNHLVGPDFGHGWLKPVEAQYDRDTDRTLIRFEHLRRQLWPPQAVLLAMQHIQKEQVLLLAEARAGNRKAINKIVWGGNNGPTKVVDTSGQSDESMGNEGERIRSRSPFKRRGRTRKRR